jgi:3'-phosphoadenosine 5'-phosphosulfate sulfotransferase (PAPS reductase)/FAD synthetase
MRVTARPVVEFTIFDIWEFIFYMRSPYNPIYHLVKRVACAGCPFAGIDEMYTLGEYRPEKLKRWVRTEQIINHPRPGTKSLQTIYQDLVKSNRLGLRAGQKIVS